MVQIRIYLFSFQNKVNCCYSFIYSFRWHISRLKTKYAAQGIEGIVTMIWPSFLHFTHHMRHEGQNDKVNVQAIYFLYTQRPNILRNLLLVLNIKSIICIPMIDISKWLTSPSTTFRNDTQKDPSLDVYAAEWDNSCSQVNLPVHSLVSEKHQQEGKTMMSFVLSTLMIYPNVFSFISFHGSKIRSKVHSFIELLAQLPHSGKSSNLRPCCIDFLEYEWSHQWKKCEK